MTIASDTQRYRLDKNRNRKTTRIQSHLAVALASGLAFGVLATA